VVKNAKATEQDEKDKTDREANFESSAVHTPACNPPFLPPSLPHLHHALIEALNVHALLGLLELLGILGGLGREGCETTEMEGREGGREVCETDEIKPLTYTRSFASLSFSASLRDWGGREGGRVRRRYRRRKGTGKG